MEGTAAKAEKKEWPIPLVLAVSGLLNEAPGFWFRRVHRLIDAFEVHIKYIAVLSIADLLDGAGVSEALQEVFLTTLRVPALGHWVNYTRLALEAIRSGNQEMFVPEVVNYQARVLDNVKHLLSLRNAYAHGATPGEPQCADDFRSAFPTFFELLEAAEFLRECDLLVAVDGELLLAMGQRLTSAARSR